MRRNVISITAVLAIAVLVCLIMPFSLVSNDGEVELELPKIFGTRVLTITTNGQLAAAASSGAGTSGSPYIIDHDTNAGGGSHGISISGTNAYFVIQTSVITNAVNGIVMSSVQNGVVRNCDISGTATGIYITSSSNMKLHNNSIYDNTADGIKINNVNTNYVIADNTIINNGHDGIGLWWFSDNNQVLRNNCSYNDNNGISLGYFSDDNLIEDNECYKNKGSGIYFKDCDGNDLITNECERNYFHGLDLTFAGNTTINGNDLWDNNRSAVRLFNSNFTMMNSNIMKQGGLTVWGDSIINWNTHTIPTTNKVNGKSLRYLKDTNSGVLPADTGQVILANCTNIQVSSKDLKRATIGIQMGFSNYNTIDQCNVSDAEYGIYLSHSHYNNVTSNVARNEMMNGIILHRSDSNKVDGNKAFHDDIGILLRFAEGNTVSNNTANYNNMGFFLWDSSKNDLFQNEGVLNSNCSVYLENAVNNSIREGNASKNNFKGIWLKYSDKNTIFGNDCLGNAENGIYAFDSENNYIAHNYAGKHPDQGILVEYFSKDNKLYYNRVFSNTLDGIYFRDDCNNAEIVGNVVYGNGVNGIHITNSSDLSDVSSNTVFGHSEAGIKVWQSDQYTVNDNVVRSNQWGIYFGYSTGNSINRNTAESNTNSGIYMDYLSNDATLTKNRLVANLYGIYITSCTGSTIKWNNFINNTGTAQAFDGSSSDEWNGLSAGNFFNEWTSPDANGDWIVDNPYTLAGAGDTDDLPLALEAGKIKIITPNDPDAYEDTFYYHDYAILTINKPPSKVYWSLQTSASWLSIDATGRISGTPSNADTGDSWVKVIVDDGTPYNRDYTNFTMTVHNVEYPPVINVTGVNEAWEDSLYSVDFNASDIDPGFVHKWSLSTNANFLTMNNDTGVLSGVPLNEDVGKYWIIVKVSDGVFNDSLSYNLTVHNTNDPPVIITNNTEWTRAMVNYAVWYQAVDEDPTNDKIEWFLKTNASFLWILRSNGTLGGTPMEGDEGAYWVNVTCKDGRGGQDSTNFTLTVAEKLGDDNRPPEVFAHPGDITIAEDEFDGSIILTDWFIDPDWNKLTFKSDANQNISIEIKSNSNVYLTPAHDWSGTEVLTFYANDSELEISDTVNVIVTPVNDPPDAVSITFENREYYANHSQPGMGEVSDVDIPYGDNFTWEWSTNSSGVIGTAQNMNLSLPPGEYIISLTVTDQGGKTAETSKNLIILPDPEWFPPNDKDLDGLPDDWEYEHFGNLAQTPGGDFDEDGATNKEELDAGTDPTVDENKIDDPDDGDKSFLEENWWWLLIAAGVVVLIIIIIIVVVATRKKEPQRPPPRETYQRDDGYFDDEDAPRRPPEEPQYKSYPKPDYSDAGTQPSVDYSASAPAPAGGAAGDEAFTGYTDEQLDEPVASPYEGLDSMEFQDTGEEDMDDDDDYSEADDFDEDEEEDLGEEEDFGDFDIEDDYDEDDDDGGDYLSIDDD